MLDYVALAILLFAFVTIFYGIIAIHDIPYEISVKRQHPHQDAIHYAGWVSLFTLHVLWPFLWIWATLYRPERGWGFHHGQPILADGTSKATDQRIAALEKRLSDCENELSRLQTPSALSSNQEGAGA